MGDLWMFKVGPEFIREEAQDKATVAICRRLPNEFVILMGDINLWFLASRSLAFIYPSMEL